MEKLVYFGKYKHFKGMDYVVIKELKIQGEKLVLYQKRYDDYSYWLRPIEMFLGEKDGVKRFTFIGEVLINIKENVRIKATHSETEKIYNIEI